ncbi:MAG TPA: hypothetical protein VIQ31_15210 [Phormidium sp.]
MDTRVNLSDFKTQLASMSLSQQGEFLAKLPAALAAKSQSEQLLKLLIDFDFIKAKISGVSLESGSSSEASK